MKPAIQIKRVYDKPLKEDGYRILVDRLWPRGLTKEEAHINDWEKSLAPSTELRKWFHHDRELWHEFQKKYITELKKNKHIESFIEKHRNNKTITLLYAAKDTEHNHAQILKTFLEPHFPSSHGGEVG